MARMSVILGFFGMEVSEGKERERERERERGKGEHGDEGRGDPDRECE